MAKLGWSFWYRIGNAIGVDIVPLIIPKPWLEDTRVEGDSWYDKPTMLEIPDLANAFRFSMCKP